jgi:hypothetical protein
MTFLQRSLISALVIDLVIAADENADTSVFIDETETFFNQMIERIKTNARQEENS